MGLSKKAPRHSAEWLFLKRYHRHSFKSGLLQKQMGYKSIPTVKQIIPGYFKSVLIDRHISLGFYKSKCAIKAFPHSNKSFRVIPKALSQTDNNLSLGFYKSKCAVKVFPQTNKLFWVFPKAFLQTDI